MTRAEKRFALARKLGVDPSGKSLKDLEALALARRASAKPKPPRAPGMMKREVELRIPQRLRETKGWEDAPVDDEDWGEDPPAPDPALYEAYLQKHPAARKAMTKAAQSHWTRLR